MTDEDQGRVQVFVILFRMIPVKLFRFSTVYGEEVGTGIVGPQGFEELFEGGMEAGPGRQQRPSCHSNRTGWAHHFESIWTTAGSCGWDFSSVGELIRADGGEDKVRNVGRLINEK